jgi:CspA family cold shock protein
MTGVIKRLVSEKGFGFISADADKVEYFFHRSAVQNGVLFEHLREGDRVTFETEAGPKGPRAGTVVRV